MARLEAKIRENTLKRKYYMLDAKDITNVKGVITCGEVLDELHIKLREFNNMVTYGKEYRGCILVEIDDDDDDDRAIEYLIAQSKHFRWYVRSDGKFIRYSKKAIKELKVYKKVIKSHGYKNIVFQVCIKQKCINAVTTYAKHFLGATDNDWVTIESDTFDINKIKIKSKYERYSVAKKQVGLFDKDKLIKKYESERQCSQDLYLTEPAVNNYLKGKVKNPMYDLRYL